MPSISETYDHLVKELKRLDKLSSTIGLLGWDEQVNLPPKSSDLRAEQMSVMMDLLHRESTRPEIGDMLEKLAGASDQLSSAQQVVVREAKKEYDREAKLPSEFVARKAEASSRGYHAWVDARKEDDFSRFLPWLKLNLDLAKEEASILGQEKAYDYWVDRFDPGMTRETIEALFGPLREQLLPIVDTIVNSPVTAKVEQLKGFPVEKQEAFLRRVVDRLGFDSERGRIDVAVHPFCGGHPLDTRMTTRFNPDTPLDSLFSVIHETGHALYQQGLPREHVGTALGSAAGMAFHESQSRSWENQLGRSREFWKVWEAPYRELFSEQLQDMSSDDFFLAINHVGLTPIRVDSDEVTYNLHIMLRFDIEKRLFDGSLDPEDLPEAWNEASREFLRYEPKNNREGCLQDVHWSGGAFGYFPSYCLGNIIAAQLWYKVNEEIPDLEDQVAQGEYGTFLNWMREKVHSQGMRYQTLELTRRITGKELAVDSLVRYLKERYLPLYT